jgi:outer membrane protein assembly factor BamA
VASGAYNEVDVRRGHREEDDVPSTVDTFPNLSGIRGGHTNPVSFSVLFNDRQDVARPTRGWSIIAKASWVPRGLGNDFEYARYLFDASYLYPLLTRRQVIGLHLGGQYLDARKREVPFYELASLGGSRDLRGFFQDRFLGDSNVMVNAEYRLKLFDFHLIWDVQIDGVAFGDAGRVFFTEEDIRAELGEPDAAIPRTDNDFRYSYGGGTRIALGDALVARLDVGFSEEEKGLIYLVFGHTF